MNEKKKKKATEKKNKKKTKKNKQKNKKQTNKKTKNKTTTPKTEVNTYSGESACVCKCASAARYIDSLFTTHIRGLMRDFTSSKIRTTVSNSLFPPISKNTQMLLKLVCCAVVVLL